MRGLDVSVLPTPGGHRLHGHVCPGGGRFKSCALGLGFPVDQVPLSQCCRNCRATVEGRLLGAVVCPVYTMGYLPHRPQTPLPSSKQDAFKDVSKPAPRLPGQTCLPVGPGADPQVSAQKSAQRGLTPPLLHPNAQLNIRLRVFWRISVLPRKGGAQVGL